tara:strand:+ start:134 stop:982 length:849 start_codon:yes stop_codon:yes gene_type:complete
VEQRRLLQDVRFAFIGTGAMGQAIIGGILSKHQLDPIHVTASDTQEDRLKEVRDAYGIQTTQNNLEAISKADVVVLAVKPQVLPAVLSELRDTIKSETLILSIVAGVTIETIAAGLNHRAVVRTMPNTPAQVGEGMTVWTASTEVGSVQIQQVTAIVDALGKHLHVSNEKFLDMATAITGSGPAYVFLLIEALVDSAVQLGFSTADAHELVVQMVFGAATFARVSEEEPAEMRNMVTSPGGTTAAAVLQLEKGAFRALISTAVQAAYLRSLELGNASPEVVK